ncbi:hypothetical protein A7C99_3440 [Trichophyton rubrum]|uniref:Uncharacterized protein n=1 Tax=Trichophyton rubrum TaxID=5551 RepID=A0A178EXW8_TRIRU|nr:hypothetical protein A7C99_3440 [Trichophyton rubrum]
MGSTQFGKFHDFCRDSTLPVCNLFIRDNQPPNEKYGGCALTGINLSSGRHIGNLDPIRFHITLLHRHLLDTVFNMAVGKKKGCSRTKGFSAAHVAAICATAWLLLLNAIVGYQLIDDGTAVSLGLLVTSALILFVGTGYIALDTAFAWTDRFQSSHRTPNQNIGLYILYLLFPLICIVGFFLLETFLVVKVLKEKRPMLYLSIAGLLFALSQIFQFVISTHLCNATDGKINGAFFETLFNLGAVNMVWVFWSSITEDDWPMNVGGAYS